MLALNLALAGLGIGSVAALTGIGLIATYRVTGVFNIGFGAVAMIVAYLLWQAVEVWHWPVGVAAAIDLLIVAPGIGWLLDVTVFRQLQRRGASDGERLVASLGVLVLFVGIAYLVWGSSVRQNPPRLFPATRIELPGGAHIGLEVLCSLGIAIAATLLVTSVTLWTRVGVAMRAVVDQRRLVELSAIDADALSSAGAAFGTFLAGVAGVLIAPQLRLDPIQLTLVVLETMAVAVAATLSRPVVALAVALSLGVAQSELTQLHPGGSLETIVRALQGNLFVVALLVAVLALPRIVGRRGDGDIPPDGLAVVPVRPNPAIGPGWAVGLFVLLLMPLGFDAPDLRIAQEVPGLAVVFVSIVAVSGLAGQLSLGQAGFAGMGALLCAALISGAIGLPAMPPLLAMVVAAVLVTPIGILTGWPAIRRRGLVLALTTFAVGTVVSRFVFAQPTFTSGLVVRRPGGFGSERAYYILQLVFLGVAVTVVTLLRRGRAGRALRAMRDDEVAARAAGVDVSRLKVEVFAVASLLAGLGGVMLACGAQSFDASVFDPVQGLIWFAAVVVFGVNDVLGAVLAAALLVGVDNVVAGTSAALVGALALLLGRFPGGIVPLLRSLLMPQRPQPRSDLQLTPLGRRVAADVQGSR